MMFISQFSNFVRTLVDDSSSIEFKPVMVVEPIKNHLSESEGIKRQYFEVRNFIEQEMLDLIVNSDITEVFRHWRTIYQLEVFMSGESEIWTFDFSDEPRVVKGRTGKINI